jgi:ABC-type polar amino acid transport system ATPase subunit
MEARVTAVLTIRHLQICRGPRLVVHDLSLTVDRGELVALMGVSGAGKTTVLRAIAGLEPFAAGDIDVDGVRLVANGLPRGERLMQLHSRVGMVFQFHHLFAHMSALRNISLAPVHVQRLPRPEAERRARELLSSLGVGGQADSLPHELSGGEAQRVAIARALAVNPPLLLMDEPTASLDAGRRGELASTLQGLVREGRTLIVATHDANFARTCAQRVVAIDAGRIVRDARASDVL